MEISPLAGKPSPQNILTNIPQLITAYYTGMPDINVPAQKVIFGTSGHRGSSLKNSYNENHILAITQAICLFRKANKIAGPLFLGFDTHALSAPAFASAVEVLAANKISIMISNGNEYTPTPVISHAILKYNAGKTTGLSDGIVITPSHNPPDDGGFKYNPPNGGPAADNITKWIEDKANEILKNKLNVVKRISFSRALKLPTTIHYDYLNNYIKDLGNVINMDLISSSGISIGVDPLGGAGVNYWQPIADRYKLNMMVVNKIVDPTFSFMTVDWDGQIRMDPSSLYAMQRLIKIKDDYDISFACDTDHDRHGIVTKSCGLLNPNQYLSVAVFYLLQNRNNWSNNSAVGKTIVTSQLINRITEKFKIKIDDVPVGFKWFSEGLFNSSLCFGGEESAGATFLRLNGKVWTTDKDGFIPALLSAEITSQYGKDPGIIYDEITKEFGKPFYDRIEAKANAKQKSKLKNLKSSEIKIRELAGEKIINVLNSAPGNHQAIGGIKVITKNGWFVARPSGTEDIYKIYAESFKSKNHLLRIIDEAQSIVDNTLKN